MRADDKIILDHGRIASFARSDKAQGGRITLQANDLIYLKDSEVASEVFGGQGTTAGDIEISTPILVQNDSRILARATEGSGGNIRIIADNLVVSQDSVIDASSQLGIDGTVVVSTPEADVTSGLVVLPAAFVDAGSRLKDSCAVRGAAETSRFARAGRTPAAGAGAAADGLLRPRCERRRRGGRHRPALDSRSADDRVRPDATIAPEGGSGAPVRPPRRRRSRVRPSRDRHVRSVRRGTTGPGPGTPDRSFRRAPSRTGVAVAGTRAAPAVAGHAAAAASTRRAAHGHPVRRPQNCPGRQHRLLRRGAFGHHQPV